MEQSTKLNGWDLEEFQQAVEAVKEEPEAGKLTWRSRAEWDAGFGLDVRTEEIEMMRSLPVWPARVALAPTIPREMSAWESYVSNFDPARLSNLKTPTLLLLGGDSPAFERAASEALDAALADGRIVVMPDQAHLAHRTAPEIFTREVAQFLVQA